MSKLVVDRIKKRPDFVRASRVGASFRTHSLVLQAAPSSESSDMKSESCRLGVTVTKKVGNAVVRNRIKRRFRALAAEILPTNGQAGYDYVLIGRKAALTTTYGDMQDELLRALRKVHAS